MTEENYNYRTSQIMLRNQFPGAEDGTSQSFRNFRKSPGTLTICFLIGFDKTSTDEQKHNARMVHFFLYDYRFECVWEKPDTVLEKLRPYRAVLSPDFSMYLEMAPVLHLYNVFRNRWCGAYWASQGLRVVPTVNWGDETTFDFCFAGIEKGSVVAVSTYMASAHDNRCDQKEWFLTGYREMLRRIEPEKIICYHTPFPEMEGNIVYVDYERSSWRYLNTRQAFSKENPDSEDFRFQGFFSVGTLSYAWGKLYRSQFLNQNKLYFEEVSYAEDKLFNMKCYLNNPKYAFLPDAVYVYRKMISLFHFVIGRIQENVGLRSPIN